jgi:hypothetical protein
VEDLINQDDDEEGEYEDDYLDVFTYEQLQDRVKSRYNGQTLAQQVELYNQSYASTQSLLQSI